MMATHQINLAPHELNVLLMANLNLALSCAQAGDLEPIGDILKRLGEIHLALKESVSVMAVKPGISASKEKRA